MHLNMIGGAYTGKSRDANLQECINWYFEPDITGGEPALMPRPGLSNPFDIQGKVIRGIHPYKISFDNIGQVIAIISSVHNYIHLFTPAFGWAGGDTRSFTSGITLEQSGKLRSSKPIMMVDNGTHLMITDGDDGFVFDPSLAIAGVKTIRLTEADHGFQGGGWCTFQDGFFVYGPEKSNFGYYSQPYDYKTFDPLNNFTAEGSSGYIVRGISVNNELWVFKDETYQIFLNTGQADRVFTPVNRPGAEGDVGCIAKHSIAKIDNTVIWLANDFTFRKAEGYLARVISTPQVTSQIRKYGDYANAKAIAFNLEGKSFYYCTFPRDEVTWAYETSTGLWTKVSSYRNSGSLVQGRFRGNCVAEINKKVYVGDYENGLIYELDEDEYQDNGEPIVLDRVATTIRNKRDIRGYTVNGFLGKLETGTSKGISNYGYEEPVAQVRYTDDSYNWSEWETEGLGIRGQYGKKVEFLNHGQVERSLNRTYHLRVISNGKAALLGADIDVEPDSRK